MLITTVRSLDLISPRLISFFQHGQGDSRVRAGKHPGQIGLRRCCCQFIFGGLFDNAICFQNRGGRLGITHRVPDPDRASQRFPCGLADFFP